MLRATKKKPREPEPIFQQTLFEFLLVHGLPVSRVEADVITWSTPPTEAQKQFASELLARKVQHSHV